MFEGMTSQEAAAQILNDGAYALLAKVGADEESLAALNKSEAAIAAALRHFRREGYEEGVSEGWKSASRRWRPRLPH